LKKPTGSVRFWFFKPGTGKTEPNRKKKLEKTEPNRKNQVKPKKPSQTQKTEPNRFEPVSVFFKKKKIQFGYFFLIKTEPKHPYLRVI